MGEQLRLVVPTGAELPALRRVMSQTFAEPDESIEGWWKTAGGTGNLRALRRGDEVIGSLVDVPMHWRAGGRDLALHGVAGVAIRPDARGSAAARALMTLYLGELYERGVPLSALYASTRGLYRSVGYGIAGRTFEAHVDTAGFRQVGDRTGAWREGSADERESVERLHTELLGRHGLVRGPYLWSRIWRLPSATRTLWVLGPGVRAWIVLEQRRIEGGWFALTVIDHGAVDAEALAQVAGLIGGHSSMAHRTKITCGADEPLLDVLPEWRGEMTLFEPWLMRIVDVPGALEGRGWQLGVEDRLGIEVVDPCIDGNRGAWALEVSGGQARVERASTASVQVDVRALAGLYTHQARVESLQKMGLVRGDRDHLRRLARMFAGEPISIRDIF